MHRLRTKKPKPRSENNMPYISTERVSIIRKQLKAMFPDFKLSITKEHHSTVNVAILSAPFDMLTPDQNGKISERKYEQVNCYWINDHYKDFPAIREVLNKIHNVINSGNGVLVEDGDYGTVPNFYVGINIGKWDKPFVCTGNKTPDAPIGFASTASPVPTFSNQNQNQ